MQIPARTGRQSQSTQLHIHPPLSVWNQNTNVCILWRLFDQSLAQWCLYLYHPTVMPPNHTESMPLDWDSNTISTMEASSAKYTKPMISSQKMLLAKNRQKATLTHCHSVEKCSLQLIKHAGWMDYIKMTNPPREKNSSRMLKKILLQASGFSTTVGFFPLTEFIKHVKNMLRV